MSNVPIFVPVVLTDEQCAHVCGALRAVIESGVAACADLSDGRFVLLAQSMVSIAEAADRARAAQQEQER